MRFLGFGLVFAALGALLLIANATGDARRFTATNITSAELAALVPRDGALAGFTEQAPDPNPPQQPRLPDTPYFIAVFRNADDQRILIALTPGARRRVPAGDGAAALCTGWREYTGTDDCPVRQLTPPDVGDDAIAYLTGDPAREVARVDTFVRDGIRVGVSTPDATPALQQLTVRLLREIDRRITAFAETSLR